MSTIKKSAYWSLISKVAYQGTLFASSVVLARYLGPKDFGVVALSLVYIGFVNLFVDAGFQNAIIQKKEIGPIELTSCFWLLTAGGIAVIMLTWWALPVISLCFNCRGIENVILAQSLIFLALPLRIVASSILSRELRIDLQAKLETVLMLAKFAASVVMAVCGLGVWSLVVPTVVAEFALSLCFAWYARWWPSFLFSYGSLKPLLSFGLDVTGSRVVWYLYSRADQFIVSRLLGAEALGIYSMALNIVNSALQFAVSFSRIAYPVFAKLQDDRKELKEKFQKMNRLANDFYFPVFAGILLVAPEFVRVFFADKWMPMVMPLRILCLVTFFRISEANFSLLLNSLGKSRATLYFNLLAVAAGVPAMYAGCTLYGLPGLLAGLCLSYVPLTLFITHWGGRHTGIGFAEFYANIGATVRNTLVMAVMVLGTDRTMSGVAPQGRLAVMIATGFVAYVGAIYFLDRGKWTEILDTMWIRKKASPIAL
jgi:O-antigen/teichoic acid export membrane protein